MQTVPELDALLDSPMEEIIESMPSGRPLICVSREIEHHSEDAEQPTPEHWIPTGHAPEVRHRIVFEFTDGPTRVTGWRKQTPEEAEALSRWDECDD